MPRPKTAQTSRRWVIARRSRRRSCQAHAWPPASRLARFTGMLTGATIATVVAIGLCGCGASSAVDPVASAAGVTQGLPGARIELTGEIVSPLSSRPLKFSGSGVVSSDPAAARLRLDFSGLLSRHLAQQQLEVRTVGRVFYMSLPSLAGRLDGEGWLKS